jgi:hypothetical protein
MNNLSHILNPIVAFTSAAVAVSAADGAKAGL